MASDALPRKWIPVILSIELTADLYHLVIVSVSPGRRRGLIVGPRGIDRETAGQTALVLLAHINTQTGGES